MDREKLRRLVRVVRMETCPDGIDSASCLRERPCSDCYTDQVIALFEPEKPDLREVESHIEAGWRPVPSEIADVLAERQRQDDKWGVQDHTPIEWLPILVEEVGEVSKAICESYFDDGGDYHGGNYYEELTQVTAVGLAMMECYNRPCPRTP